MPKLPENALESAGNRLFAALSDDIDPAWLTLLIVEAARIADRLDRLNELVAGGERIWLRLTEGRDGVLEVRMDSALQESRQQATVLKQLIFDIRRHKEALGGSGGDPDDPLDDL